MLAFRSGEIRFICHSITLGFIFRGGDNYADIEDTSLYDLSDPMGKMFFNVLATLLSWEAI